MDEKWRGERFEIFAPIVSHGSENGKKIVKKLKNEHFDLEKEKKVSGDMVERELPRKFGMDPCRERFLRNLNLRTDDGRTDDGRLRHDSSSADKVKHS